MANNANNAEPRPEGFDVYLTTRHWVRVINVVNNRIVAIDRAMWNGTITDAMRTERDLLQDSLFEINVAAHETGIHRLVYGVTGEDEYNEGSMLESNNGSNNGRNNGSNNGNNNGANAPPLAANNIPRNEASRAAEGPGPSSTSTRRRRGRKNRKTRRT
jgi:hypothetical protein